MTFAGLIKKFNKDNYGNFGIIGAFSLVAVIGVSGLAVDYNAASQAQNNLQSVVDSAALMSAAQHAESGEGVKLANKYISDNVKNAQLTKSPEVIHDTNAQTVEVTAEAKVPTHFSALFGKDDFTIIASSTALYEGSAGANSEPEVEAEPELPYDPAEGPDLSKPESFLFVMEASNSFDENYNPKDDFSDDIATRIKDALVLRVMLMDDRTPIDSRFEFARRGSLLFLDKAEMIGDMMGNSSIGENVNKFLHVSQTGLVPYNDGFDEEQAVGLDVGINHTSNAVSALVAKEKDLPVLGFEAAVDQLLADKYVQQNGRRAIVYFSDGKPQPGMEVKTQEQRLMERCKEAKEKGIEIFTFGMGVPDAELQSFRACASPNGSANGYKEEQKQADAFCQTAITRAEQEQCDATKSNYLFNVQSPWGFVQALLHLAESKNTDDAQSGPNAHDNQQLASNNSEITLEEAMAALEAAEAEAQAASQAAVSVKLIR